MKAIEYLSHQLAEKIKKEAELMELVHQQNQTIDQLLAERQHLTDEVTELKALLEEETAPADEKKEEESYE